MSLLIVWLTSGFNSSFVAFKVILSPLVLKTGPGHGNRTLAVCDI